MLSPPLIMITNHQTQGRIPFLIRDFCETEITIFLKKANPKFLRLTVGVENFTWLGKPDLEAPTFVLLNFTFLLER